MCTLFMITMINKLTYPLPPIVIVRVCVCVVRILEIYSLRKFQDHNTLLLTTVPMLYITLLELIHLITESLYPLINISPFAQTLSLW